MRVVHLVNNLQTGGIETQLVDLLPHLSALADQEVVTLRDSGGPLAAKALSLGFPVHHCAISKGGWWSKNHRLRTLLDRLAPDVVHAHSRFPAAMGVYASFLAGVPSIFAHYYALPSKSPWNSDKTRRERFSLGRAGQFLFCSADVQSDFHALHPGWERFPQSILPCGIDTEKFAPPEKSVKDEARRRSGVGPEVPLLGIVARIVPLKNHPLLIEAAAMLKGRGVDFRLWIIGPGEAAYVSELQALARRLSVADRIEFKGFCEDLPATLSMLDGFVLCSQFEGMPLSVQEAWACGLPVVGTRVPGLRFFIRHEVDGILCSPGDPEALAAAMERLVTDAGLRERLGKAALERAPEFSVQRVAAQTSEIYGIRAADAARTRTFQFYYGRLRSRLAARGNSRSG